MRRNKKGVYHSLKFPKIIIYIYCFFSFSVAASKLISICYTLFLCLQYNMQSNIIVCSHALIIMSSLAQRQRSSSLFQNVSLYLRMIEYIFARIPVNSCWLKFILFVLLTIWKYHVVVTRL